MLEAMGINFSLFKKIVYFNFFWLYWVFAAHGLSLVVESGGYSLVVVCGLLIAVASLVASHRLCTWASVIVMHGLSCPMECGIFLDQGLNPCPLH